MSDKELKDCGRLGLKAAGLKIPYITVLGVSLPRLGVLIIEDPADSYMKQKTCVLGVLGINVFNPLYVELCKQYGSDLWEVPVSRGWRNALRYCQMAATACHCSEVLYNPTKIHRIQYILSEVTPL